MHKTSFFGSHSVFVKFGAICLGTCILVQHFATIPADARKNRHNGGGLATPIIPSPLQIRQTPLSFFTVAAPEPNAFQTFNLSVGRTSCPSGYILHTGVGTCLKAVTRPMSWFEASTVCAGDGGALIAITSAPVQAAVRELLLSDLSLRFFMRGPPVIGSFQVNPSKFKARGLRGLGDHVFTAHDLSGAGQSFLPTIGVTAPTGSLVAFWTGGNALTTEGEFVFPTIVSAVNAPMQLTSMGNLYTNFAAAERIGNGDVHVGTALNINFVKTSNCIAIFAPLNFEWVSGDCASTLPFVCQTNMLARKRSPDPISSRDTSATVTTINSGPSSPTVSVREEGIDRTSVKQALIDILLERLDAGDSKASHVKQQQPVSSTTTVISERQQPILTLPVEEKNNPNMIKNSLEQMLSLFGKSAAARERENNVESAVDAFPVTTRTTTTFTSAPSEQVKLTSNPDATLTVTAANNDKPQTLPSTTSTTLVVEPNSKSPMPAADSTKSMNSMMSLISNALGPKLLAKSGLFTKLSSDFPFPAGQFRSGHEQQQRKTTRTIETSLPQLSARELEDGQNEGDLSTMTEFKPQLQQHLSITNNSEKSSPEIPLLRVGVFLDPLNVSNTAFDDTQQLSPSATRMTSNENFSLSHENQVPQHHQNEFIGTLLQQAARIAGDILHNNCRHKEASGNNKIRREQDIENRPTVHGPPSALTLNLNQLMASLQQEISKPASTFSSATNLDKHNNTTPSNFV